MHTTLKRVVHGRETQKHLWQLTPLWLLLRLYNNTVYLLTTLFHNSLFIYLLSDYTMAALTATSVLKSANGLQLPVIGFGTLLVNMLHCFKFYIWIEFFFRIDWWGAVFKTMNVPNLCCVTLWLCYCIQGNFLVTFLLKNFETNWIFITKRYRLFDADLVFLHPIIIF